MGAIMSDNTCYMTATNGTTQHVMAQKQDDTRRSATRHFTKTQAHTETNGMTRHDMTRTTHYTTARRHDMARNCKAP